MIPHRLVTPIAGLMLLALCACSPGAPSLPASLSDRDPDRGRTLLRQLGCGTCHAIPGVPGANGRAGPSLAEVRKRGYLAGEIPNTPENLVRWIRFPEKLVPRTAMPGLDVDETDARDMAAYLYALE